MAPIILIQIKKAIILIIIDPLEVDVCLGDTSLNFMPHVRQKSYPGDTSAPHFPQFSATINHQKSYYVAQ